MSLRVGVVGFGFMGRMHFQAWKKLDGVQVVAICDQVAPTETVVGNIAGAEKVDLKDVLHYTDLGTMLAEASLDIVSIALPSHLHPAFTVQALASGVHTLVEKPMALDLAACDEMISAAEASGKQLMVAQCIRFWPEYEKAHEIVAGGQYGRVVAGNFRRLGSVPTWNPDAWFLDDSKSGGLALDLHVHDTDFILHLLGMPDAVQSVGGRNADNLLVHMSTQYHFKDLAISAEASWAMTDGFGFAMTFDLVLEKAVISFDSRLSPTLKIYPADGGTILPDLAEGDGYTREIAHFLSRVQGKIGDDRLTLSDARRTVQVVLAERESLASGRPVALEGE